MSPRRPQLLDPGDHEQVIEYIEDMARYGQGKELYNLLNDITKPIHKDRLLRPNSKLDIDSYCKRVAGACQLRGKVQEHPCVHCINNGGPWRDCVYLSGYNNLTKMCCANCQFGLRTTGKTQCSMSEGRPYKSRRVRQAMHVPSHAGSNTLPTTALSAISSSIASNSQEPLIREDDWAVSNSTGDLHIIGDLYLSSQSLENQSIDVQNLFWKLQSDLEQLECRDISTLSKPIQDIREAFSEFQVKEQESWIASNHEAPPPEHLVLPSGSFKSPISHRLNQPSFSTSRPNNWETADAGNGCVSAVMGSAFNHGETLIYDQLPRRSVDSKGLQVYPEKVLECHDDFIRQISESSEAKVEVVYGQPVQQYLKAQLKNQYTILPLWGDYEGVQLLLVHETAFRNQQNSFKFRRILVFVAHPQRSFYWKYDDPDAEKQDRLLTVAGLMSRVPHPVDYYKRKKWMKYQPNPLTRAAIATFSEDMKEFYGAKKSAGSKQLVDRLPDDQIQLHQGEKRWEQYFEEFPHSNEALQKILPIAIQATIAILNRTPDWKNPSDFPVEVFNWFKGQKHILFPNVTVSGLDEIIAVFRDLKKLLLPVNKEPAFDAQMLEEKASLQYMLLQIMRRQQEYFQQRKKPSIYDDLCHSRFDGRTITLKCYTCGIQDQEDPDSMFAVNRPNHVISRSIRCRNCAKLKGGTYGRTRCYIPSGSDLWTNADRHNLRSKAPKRSLIMLRDDVTAILQPESTLDAPFTQPVETVCICCKDDTKTVNGKAMRIDEKPRWTIGKGRPLYVEHISSCYNCDKIKGKRKRFIPRNPNLPSITTKGLDAFLEMNRTLPIDLQERLLEKLEPAKRVERKSAKAGKSNFRGTKRAHSSSSATRPIDLFGLEPVWSSRMD